MAKVYKRDKKGKVYWATFYDRSRKRNRYFSTHKESASDAEAVLAEKLIALKHHQPTDFDKVIFDDLIPDFYRDYDVKKRRTKKRAERNVGYLLQAFGGMKAIDITPDLIEQYKMKRYKQGMAVATVNRELASLHRIFTIAKKFKKIADIPEIEIEPENNKRKGFFERDQFLRLKAVLPDYLVTPTQLAYESGMRKAEVFSLKRSQVDFANGVIRLEDTKTDEPREFYPSDDLLEQLKSLPQTEWVFTHNGKPIKDFRTAWASACRKAGLEGRLFHDLRRTGVRNSVRSGTPEDVCMKISGHSTRSVFRRYNIVSGADLKEAKARLQKHFENLDNTTTTNNRKAKTLPSSQPLENIMPGEGFEPSQAGKLEGF